MCPLLATLHHIADIAPVNINYKINSYISQDISDNSQQDTQQGTAGYELSDEDYNEIFENIGLYGIDKTLGSGSGDVSFYRLFTAVRSGDGEYVRTLLIAMLKKATVEDILLNKRLIGQLIIIVLAGSVFVKLAGSLGGGFVSEQGFYVTYLLITSLLLTSFLSSMNIVSTAIGHVITSVKVIIPVYALSMNFIGSNVTSVGMYEIIMIGIGLVQVVISYMVLPLIKFYVIVALVNNVNNEDSFSKMCRLIHNLVSWMLKTIVVFIAGLSLIKSLLEPQMDILGKHSLGRLISAIPGGGMSAVLTGTFLKAGLVIKNSIGVTGIITIIAIVLSPVIKVMLVMLMIRLTAAILQPIGEKRYVNGIESLAQGMALLLQAIGSCAALFMLTIAIMAYASN